MNNGVEIPKLGYGTWMIDNDAVVEAVKTAIEIGYTHIDTAQAYQNEEGVGKGLQRIFNETSIKRGDVFITTKLWPGRGKWVYEFLTALFAISTCSGEASGAFCLRFFVKCCA